MDFSDLFLLPGNAGCASALRLTRPVYDPAKKCKDAVVPARQILTFFK